MPDTPIERLLSKLPSAKPAGENQWLVRCPAHDDRRASLSIGMGNDGRALLRCHAGCAVESVVAAIGLKMTDLMPNGDGTALTKAPAKPKTIYPTALAAVEALEQSRGPRSAAWTYWGADGKPAGTIVRWDLPDGGKRILPVSRNGSGWSQCGMPAPRPLFCLRELADASTVYICEGEKVVMAARAIELKATTSAHGSNSAAKADWSVCAGKECIILPDDDGPGRKYAEAVAHILYELYPRPGIKIVELPGLPDGGDLVDWLAVGRTREELEKLVERTDEWVPTLATSNDNEPSIHAKSESSTDKTPQRKKKRERPQVPAFQPFPVGVLPEPLRGFVSVSSKAIGCDSSFVALPLLAGLASAIGSTHQIQIKHGWSEPAVLWCAIIGESGSLKSPAVDAALRRIRERQARALAVFKEQMEGYEREVEVHQADMTEWRKTGHKNGEPPPLPPDKPASGRCWCSDTTVEALAALLDGAPRGILVIRDELSGWLRGFDAYKGSRGADVAHYLEMHRAGHLLVDRKTGDKATISVPRAAVSIVGGIQPETLRRALGEENFENGLAARFLMTMPPRRTKRWRNTTLDRALEDRLSDVFDWLFALEAGMNEHGDARPVLIPLSSEGLSAWIGFYDDFAAEQSSLTGPLAAAASKLEGAAGRLALVIHLVRCATGELNLGDPIDEVSVGAGVKLVRWFIRETRRVYMILAETDEERGIRQLVELIRRKGGRISVRDFQRCRSHPNSDDAEAELAKLVEAGIGAWESVPPGSSGGRPSRHFVLTDIPDTDKTPAHDPGTGGFVSVSSVSGDNNDDGDDWGVV